ncbi:hypothetical protein HanIR_Chr04g0200981 [Helianthus annuus]|nr:hypothetical protein HanIR_Chr04g0200981 [Helianthus annuus]
MSCSRVSFKEGNERKTRLNCLIFLSFRFGRKWEEIHLFFFSFFILSFLTFIFFSFLTLS